MRSRGLPYGAAAFGALLGLLLLLVGWWLGDAYVDWFMSGGGFDMFFPPVIGALAGLWLGALVGCALALRHLAADPATARTTVLLGFLLPLGIASALWVVATLRVRFPSSPILGLSMSGILISLALLSRWIAARTTPPEAP